MRVISPKIHVSNIVQPLHPKQLTSDSSFERVRLANLTASGVVLKNFSLEESLCDKVQIIQSDLERLVLADVVVRASDFSAANCAGSGLRRVTITGCRLSGIDFSNARLKDVVFEDCKLDMANFRTAQLERVSFKDCSLQATDFPMSKLKDITFSGSTLDGVLFGNSTMQNLDLRSASLGMIHGIESLKGAVIDTVQLVSLAPQLATALGMDIQE